MKKLLQKGFTLIELLIVIGILGILVVAVLLTLNPQEGQRKARDTQRMKDLATLQAVMDQLVADNTLSTNITANSSMNSASRSCGGGWLGVDVCRFVTNLPTDPVNKSTSVAGATGVIACPTTLSAKPALYYVSYDAATNTYEVNVRQESASNCAKLTGDGGNSNFNVEAGTYQNASGVALTLIQDN